MADFVAGRSFVPMTLRESPTTGGSVWRAVEWAPSLGLFCAIEHTATGTAGRVATSTDGDTWIARSIPVNIQLSAICWSEHLSLFVILSDSLVTGSILTSNDGIAWMERQAPFIAEWTALCWSQERLEFLAVSIGNANGKSIMNSTDGVNWAQHSPAGWSSPRHFSDICYIPELDEYQAVCSEPDTVGTTRVMYSYIDSHSWQLVDMDFNAPHTSICWASRILRCVVTSLGKDPDTVTYPETFQIISADARSALVNRALNPGSVLQIFQGRQVPPYEWRDVIWVPELGLFFAIASSSTRKNRLMTSIDGEKWEQRRLDYDYGWRGMCWSKELNLVVLVSEEAQALRFLTIEFLTIELTLVAVVSANVNPEFDVIVIETNTGNVVCNTVLARGTHTVPVATSEAVFVYFTPRLPAVRLGGLAYDIGTEITLGDLVTYPYTYRCVVRGVTSTTQPVFSTVVGGITVDGLAEWLTIDRITETSCEGPFIPIKNQIGL